MPRIVGPPRAGRTPYRSRSRHRHRVRRCRRAARSPDPHRHDRVQRTHQATRRPNGRRGRLLQVRARDRDGFPRSERAGKPPRCDALRAATPTPAGRACSAAPTASCPTPAGASACCSTPRRSTPGAAGARARALGAADRRAEPPRRRAARARRARAPAARKRVRQYSLGMRQRLGLAHALLGDPEVLILDEPANGLDPEGMRWMRGLLRDFADRGGTVLLSSHLLARGRGDRRPTRDHRRRADRRPGRREELLAGAGTLVRGGRCGCAGGRAATPPASTRARPPTAPSSSMPSPRRSGAPRWPAGSPSPAWARRGGRPGAAVLRPDHRGGHDERRRRYRPSRPGPDTRPGLARLTLVELRKMTDTCAGFCLGSRWPR